MLTRARASITGIVQGVGFRPFVYRLAREGRLTGFVTNTPAGVDLEVQGERGEIDRFFLRLGSEAPPLARITAVERLDIRLQDETAFTIEASRSEAPRQALISPDTCVCADCLREMRDPLDRRYGYPFINCTNCGPRYTIIKDVPYDRPFTTMAPFQMCQACKKEYEDPADRRFHAQPNACWDCGPRLSYHDSAGNRLPVDDPIATAAEALADGKIVAIKGLGGFHLAVDGANNEAVRRLRLRKQREEKPLAIMSATVEKIREYAELTEEDIRVLTSPIRPILIVPKRKDRNLIAEETAPRSPNLGVMLPYTPLHFLLLDHPFLALVMTSANLSEEPICIDNDEAFRRLGDIADFFLVHNRDIYLRSDDSVTRRFAGRTRLLRRSRGYAPAPVFLKRETLPTLALGGELKNTVCLTKGDRAFISQHVGDLENLETLEFFELTISHLRTILDIRPQLLAYDLHPRYLSTQYALEHKKEYPRSAGVQHHHAHIVSLMAEQGLDGEVIGLAMDGSGYGTDGTVWGGEILRVRASSFERLGHFATTPMPGGEKAIKEPVRMAISYLYQTYGWEFLDMGLDVVERMGRKKAAALVEMMEKKLNSPLTSSCGRLFEGVAALVGIRDRNAYEGQAAIEMEALAENPRHADHYPWTVTREQNGPYLIYPQPIITGVVDDLKKGIPAGAISARFHASIMACWEELCLAVREETGLNRVALSGGVFQNALLAELLPVLLERHGFEVFQHEQTPANDGCVSLGQAVVINAMAEEGLLEQPSRPPQTEVQP